MTEARFSFGLPAKCNPPRLGNLSLLGALFLLLSFSPGRAQKSFCSWEHPASLGAWYQAYRHFSPQAGPVHFPPAWTETEADFARLLWYWQRRLSGGETYEDSLRALHRQYGLTGDEAALAPPEDLLMGALSQTFLAREAALGTNPVPVVKRYLETGGYLRALRQYEDSCAVLALLSDVYDASVKAAEDRMLFYPLVVLLPDARERGLSRLRKRAQPKMHPFIQTEARYFLFKIHAGILDQEITGRKHLRKLAEQYPRNPILQLEWAQLLPASMKEERQQVRQRMEAILEENAGSLDAAAKSHFRALWRDQQVDW